MLINQMQEEIDGLPAELSIQQNVINGGCLNGNSIRGILVDGPVICEHDDFGGGTTYLYAYTASVWELASAP